MFKSFVVAAALVALPANAAVITTLYSTGVDNAGVATTGNGADLHWTLLGGTAYTGGTNGVYPIGPWVSETTTSRWITPTPNAGDTNPPVAFTYSTTFSLAGLDPTTASFSGDFAADDGVTAIILNGVTIAAPGGGYSYPTAFSSAGGTFVAGVNTLSFVTLNNGGGPTGLNVAISGTADAVPEAATWAMMVAGFGLVGAGMRRRSGAVAA